MRTPSHKPAVFGAIGSLLLFLMLSAPASGQYSPPGGHATHGTVLCPASVGTPLLLTSAATLDVNSRTAVKLLLLNESTTVVRILSTNGQASSKGLPLCNAAGCLSTIALTVNPDHVLCISEGSAQAIHVFGVN